MKHVGIIMSAGVGHRMEAETPKQYMDLCGKPVLYYSLKAMQDSFLDEIIIVVGSGDEEYVKKDIVDRFSFSKVKKIVPGGKERSDSVYSGLCSVENPESSYVYIHDSARPFLNSELLIRCKEDAECFGSSVLGVPSKDTVKIVGPEGFVVTTPDRKYLWNIQTPQVFKADDLILAYEAFLKDKEASVTDDASVIESYGTLPVHITMGDYRNIKITTPDDLETLKKFL